MSTLKYKIGEKIEGYEIIRVEELTELDAGYIELVHTKSGARHIHIQNKDKENTFSVIFKTVPTDSSGVAHILEHTVLCGSNKFPVRDPFFSMIKRSLNTFMNAFTSSDWTMYPFSTENKKDFYNLMDVYTNAVFFPELTELSFKQEGHRLERDDNNKEKLVFKGIVYNEMKGAMSSPNQIMIRSLLKSLYPDTTYSNNSGGNPSDIPNLTHDALRKFHKKYYHPSNSTFYTYGDLPLSNHLQFLDQHILSAFGKTNPNSDVPPQPRWNKPKKETFYYPISKNDDQKKKYQGALAWLTADTTDNYEVLILSVLSEILLGNAASPLHKALIDSGFGTALSDGSGFDPDNRDAMFSCGLKDIEKKSADKVETLVMNVLNDLFENGIDRELTETAIHQIEFHRKERTNSPYPYGIKLMLGISGSLIHKGDPLEVLNLDESFIRLREDLNQEKFLEKKIKYYFIDNTHRITFTLAPDSTLQEKEQEKEEDTLKKIMSSCTPEELIKIDRDTKKLTELQEKDEDISVLPTLSLKDIKPDIKKVTESGIYKKLPAVYYNQPTSGIYYFTSALGAGGLDPELLDYIPVFCNVFTKMGSAKRDFVKLTRKIDATTGGISASCHPRTDYNKDGECLPIILFNGKALARNRHNLIDILSELFTQYDFNDTKRLKNLLLEYRAGFESAVIQNGHSFSISLASSNLTQSGFMAEKWNGLTHLNFIKNLLDEPTDDHLSKIAAKLKKVADALINQSNIKYAIVGQEEFLSDSRSLITTFNHSIKSDGNSGFNSPLVTPPGQIINAGWYTNTTVSFVAQAHKVARLSHRDSPALAVISKMMRSMYLHREIREKGGAYGGFAIYNSEDGVFNFGSYRDPHIMNTLDVFENSASFIIQEKFTDEDIKEAVLQVCSGIDKPDSPGASAKKAFFRNLISLKDEERQKFKKNLLLVTKNQVIDVAERYFNRKIEKSTVIISNKEKIEETNKKLKGRFDLKQI